jgi:hypothetical protein
VKSASLSILQHAQGDVQACLELVLLPEIRHCIDSVTKRGRMNRRRQRTIHRISCSLTAHLVPARPSRR